MRLWSFVSLCVALPIAACDPQVQAPSSSAQPPGQPAPAAPGEPVSFEPVPFEARFNSDGVYVLDPAVPLPFTRIAPRDLKKADEFDNARARAPQNFAITAPPERIATVRPMVEWEPMQALVFTFPSYTTEMENATSTFVNIAKTAADHGEVWVVVDTASAETKFKQRLTRAGFPEARIGTDVRFWRAKFDSYWLVDFGPLPLIDTATDTYAFSDFRYYHERPGDDALSTLLGRNLTALGAPSNTSVYRMPLTTEGGTFQSTTDGICITSSRQIYNMSCYVGDCRESILDLSLEALQVHQHTQEMKSVLTRYAGCRDLIVTHSVTDDGTGHIDIYLKILDDNRILVGEYRRPYTHDAQRDNEVLMDQNAAFLEAYLVDGQPRFQVVRMAMPGHQRVFDPWFGQYDVPFTYINSTFFNGVNLWPAYPGVPEWAELEAETQQLWEQILPDMEHVAIDTEELALQSGAIHCVTRTVPKKAPALWVENGECNEGTCGGVEGGYDGQCVLGNNSDLCFGPDWLCGCNDCRACPEAVETPCQGISWRGCCDGGDVLFCEGGQLKSQGCGETGCGWSAVEGFYNCGLSGADPSGANPEACSCVPACDGRTCGPDGCGGTCGTCGEGEQCVTGECRDDCVACTPGEVGCDGTTSWVCVEGVEGCNTAQRVDCAASGLVCEDGECASAPQPDPDSDVVDGDVAGDTSGEDTGSTKPKKDEGCAGGAVGLWPLALVGLALRRRVR